MLCDLSIQDGEIRLCLISVHCLRVIHKRTYRTSDLLSQLSVCRPSFLLNRLGLRGTPSNLGPRCLALGLCLRRPVGPSASHQRLQMP